MTCNDIHWFGAGYPDATCIDGFLWDLDSCDEPGGGLREGGEVPCPQCCPEAFAKHFSEEVMDCGYIAAEDGKPVTENPVNPKKCWPGTWSILHEAWVRGWQEFHRRAAA